jgi:N-carbamoyl-L-amino-acid hydrolase
VSELRVNRERLWDSLVDTSKFGATPAGGMNRLTLTDEDRMVRDLQSCRLQRDR